MPEATTTNVIEGDQSLQHNEQILSNSWQPTLSCNILSNERGFYRSKILTTHTGINPLIAAATSLFSIAGQLTNEHPTQALYTFHQQLIHEIKAFENSAQTNQYRSETILVARYILCATLDELILNTDWGKRNNWQQHKLLVAFYQETQSDERFFIILEKLAENPAIHIDLLEFIYLCLSLGYEGKYRYEPRGNITLAEIMDKLFAYIRQQRGDLKKDINVVHNSPSRPPTSKLHFPFWLIICFTATLLLTIYSSFSYLLSADAVKLYQEINPLLAQLKHNDAQAN